MAKIYTLVTGISMTGDEMHLGGQRISNLAKIYNLREGLGRAEDNVPIRCMKDPIKSGVAKGSVVTQKELDILLDDYYETRGWTKEGVPTKEKMKELGLSSYDKYVSKMRKKSKS
jgi:aldehyde:ferredoxin oxidoreductase